MDVLIIYTYVVTGLAGFLLLQRYVARCIRFVLNPRLIFLFFRCLVLPYIFRRRRLWGPVTRLQIISHAIYLGGTFTCNIWGVSGFAAASSRAASLAVLHLVPALFVPQLSLAADITGISLSVCHQLHRTLGLMACFQSALHIIASLHTTKFNWNDRIQQYGLMVRGGSFLTPTKIIFYSLKYRLLLRLRFC
jgi:hypothetical protein